MPTISELPAATLAEGDLIPAVVDGVTSAVAATTVGASVFNAADAAAARTAIGAGTSSLAIGTTASTAKAGDYQPTWEQVSGKPAVIAAGADAATARTAIGAGTSSLTLGTTASTALAGNGVPGRLQAITGYDAGATQTLKNVSGTLTWVTDE